MRLGPPSLLATTFGFLLAASAATLIATARIAEAGAPTRPAGARMREAPALAPSSQVHSLFLARRDVQAYGRYADLADAGDPAAASLALASGSGGLGTTAERHVLGLPALWASDDPAASSRASLQSTLDALEALLIEDALKRNKGHVESVCRALDVSPATLYRKLKAHGLQIETHRDE